MGEVAAKINGRIYRLTCADGQEARLAILSDMVREKVDGLVAEFGQAGENRLLVMAAVMLADELLELREGAVKPAASAGSAGGVSSGTGTVAASVPGGSVPGAGVPGGSVPGGSIPGASLPGASAPGGGVPGAAGKGADGEGRAGKGRRAS